jgi:hypothetical protein
MKALPAEVQFHEDVRLFVWRPRGVLDEAALNKVLGYLEDLEAKLQAPFNRLLRSCYWSEHLDVYSRPGLHKDYSGGEY